VLFGESQSRIILSAKPDDLERIKALAQKAEVPLSVLGFAGGKRLTVSICDEHGRAAIEIDQPCQELDIIWCGALRSALESPQEVEGRQA
jgi:phosphoribosylformylglycinamidine (FGAM) synthase-like enzyme